MNECSTTAVNEPLIKEEIYVKTPIKIKERTPEDREAYYQKQIAKLYSEIRRLNKKLRRRDNKIIELEDKLKHEHDWDDYKDGDFSGGR